MSTSDRCVLRALQVLVLALPLFLGGRHPLGVALGLATVLALLAWTVRERGRRGEGAHPTGVAALAGFVALGLATTVPLPPTAIEWLSPQAAEIYKNALPGWPGAGGWSEWRPLALDAFGVWIELCKLGIAFGAFAVLVAYPWQGSFEEDADGVRLHVFGVLVVTLLAGGAAFSLLALVQEAATNGRVLWVLDEVADPARASGPFVNPNHFAAWLEIVIPAGVAYGAAVSARLARRIARSAETSRAMGVRARRAWAGALAANQGRFWLPLVVGSAVVLMLLAHLATGSRGGMAGLLVGLAVAGFGIARTARAHAPHGALRWVAPALVAALVGAALFAVASWARLEDEATVASGGGDASLASRVVVAAQGRAIVRDFPVFGTGLGSWLHAFRAYQAPPVDYGIWDHAHDDYLELAADTGALGLALAALFAFAVVGAARGRGRSASRATDVDVARPRDAGRALPPGFEMAEWRTALARSSWLRWGMAGGAAAVLVHSFVDFGLRMPANLLLLFVVGALVLVSRPARGAGGSWAVAALLVALCAAAAPVVSGRLAPLVGRTSNDPAALMAAADAALAEDGDQARAVALARTALDASPASREAHEALATAYGSGPESVLALRRAIRLDPSASELRDRLVRQLASEGALADAARELEESVALAPDLDAHVLPDGAVAPTAAPAPSGEETSTRQFLRDLADGPSLKATLADLDPALAAAAERGLRRALDERPAGRPRQEVVDDLVLLLEARERFAEAGAELRAAAAPTPEDALRLARAASDFLAANQPAAAEEALIAALKLTPEQGELYRTLAVDVFAARGDFAAAEQVLRAAQDNSQDMLPVYRGLTKVLSMREAARFDAAVQVPIDERVSALEDPDRADAPGGRVLDP